MSKMREEIARCCRFLYIIHHFDARINHFFLFSKTRTAIQKNVQSIQIEDNVVSNAMKIKLENKLQEKKCMNFKHIQSTYYL